MAYLNIRDFGARGDGRTDDTPALERALEATTHTEGTLYFPSGNYCIRPVHIPSHITLLGHSAWSDGHDEASLGTVRLTALSGDAPALLDLTGCIGTRIIGLTLDGRGLGTCMHGIYSRHGGVEQNNCYEDLRVSNFTGCGLRMDWVWVFAIRRCLIADNRLHGIDVDRGYDGWVMDNRILRNGQWGVNAGPGMVCYTANQVEDNRAGGLLADDTQNINVTANLFARNGGPAVSFRRSRASALCGNLSLGDGADTGAAYELRDSVGIAMTGNAALRSGTGVPALGVAAEKLADGVISENALPAARDAGGHSRNRIGGNALRA